MSWQVSSTLYGGGGQPPPMGGGTEMYLSIGPPSIFFVKFYFQPPRPAHTRIPRASACALTRTGLLPPRVS